MWICPDRSTSSILLLGNDLQSKINAGLGTVPISLPSCPHCQMHVHTVHTHVLLKLIIRYITLLVCIQESKSTKKLIAKDIGKHKETFHFPCSHGRLWGIAVSPTGNIFVSDFAKYNIHVFNIQRQYIQTFGEVGIGKGQLKNPRGLAVDASGLVYVANEGNGRVEVFKEDGSFVRQIGVGQLKSPWDVTIIW